MKANDTTIRTFLEGTKQFIVPLFQRTYSWRKRNIQTMWNDLNATLEDGGSSHFFGSFVTMPIPTSASGVSKYTIIDGQQRLSTICLLLAALRDRVVELNPDYKNREEINEQYLFNKFLEDDRHKVVPTEADRDTFFSILDGSNDDIPSDNRLAKAFAFFRNEFDKVQSLDQLLALKDALISSFLVVDIRLETGDDPYLIFESLNATGAPLTQADLIRNYLFMGISEQKQLRVYRDIWLPMQETLGDNLEDFFRHYLAMAGDIPNIQRVYATFREAVGQGAGQDSLREEAVIGMVKRLERYSAHYNRLLHPGEEPKPSLQDYFSRFNRLRLTTSYPLLLNLYDDYAHDRMSVSEFANCLKLVEVLVVRRAVCGIPTNVLNKYFPAIYDSLDRGDWVDSLRNQLKGGTGARRMPDDEEFKRCLVERKLYGNRVLKYVLEEIERHDNKEVVDFEGLQVEHIMPQTLTEQWKLSLGENWDLIHRKYGDTLGNLTLTGYNPEYSNRDFAEKRDMESGFKDSGLRINRSLSNLQGWGDPDITMRAEELADIALQVWNV